MIAKNNLNLAFADGSLANGMGHLFRLTRIIDQLDLREKFLFLSKSDFQSEFYDSRNFNFLKIDDLQKINKCKLFIIDSKANETKFIKEMKQISKFIISVDCTKCWTKNTDLILIPSFFINKKSIQKKCIQNNKILYGKGYVPLTPSKKEIPGINLLISFGGSDPNNLTSKILSKLPCNFHNKSTFVLIGPGFKNIMKLKNKFSHVNFVENKNSITDYIKSSKRVITALGTTLQECERYSKITGVVFNYKKDYQDFRDARSSSLNPSHWYNFGHYNSINPKTFKDFFDNTESRALEKLYKKDDGWGNKLKFLQDLAQ